MQNIAARKHLALRIHYLKELIESEDDIRNETLIGLGVIRESTVLANNFEIRIIKLVREQRSGKSNWSYERASERRDPVSVLDFESPRRLVFRLLS